MAISENRRIKTQSCQHFSIDRIFFKLLTILNIKIILRGNLNDLLLLRNDLIINGRFVQSVGNCFSRFISHCPLWMTNLMILISLDITRLFYISDAKGGQLKICSIKKIKLQLEHVEKTSD